MLVIAITRLCDGAHKTYRRRSSTTPTAGASSPSFRPRFSQKWAGKGPAVLSVPSC